VTGEEAKKTQGMVRTNPAREGTHKGVLEDGKGVRKKAHHTGTKKTREDRGKGAEQGPLLSLPGGCTPSIPGAKTGGTVED